MINVILLGNCNTIPYNIKFYTVKMQKKYFNFLKKPGSVDNKIIYYPLLIDIILGSNLTVEWQASLYHAIISSSMLLQINGLSAKWNNM